MEEIEEVVLDMDALKATMERNNDVSGAAEDWRILMKKLDELQGKAFEDRGVTIFRLPPWYSEINPQLCEPKMVSIGPYHHGKKSLRTMEEHKWFVLRDFLDRNKDVNREVYFQAMRSIEAQARQCYSETLDMRSDDFVMMLLLDGCFILEWFLKFDSRKLDAICNVGWVAIDIFSDFLLLENQLPFFVIHKLFAIQDKGMKSNENCQDHCPLLKLLVSVLNQICADLWLILSTQMLCPPRNNINHLLHLLYTGVVTDIQPQPQRKQGNSDIGKFLSESNKAVSDQRSEPFRNHSIPCVSELHNASVNFKIHIPHRSYRGMLHNFMMPPDLHPQPQRKQGNSIIGKLHNFWSKFLSKSNKGVSDKRGEPSDDDYRTIPRVSDLHDAGIKFKRKKNPRKIFDISFENGTIEMPVLLIDLNKARMIWNMVAFEQTKLGQGFPQTLSSYLALMDSLVNVEKDVALLEQSGSIGNFFQNAEELAAFFNQFGRVFSLNYTNHYFYWLYKEVKEYSESTWHVYRARLMQDYFSNPWSIISVVVAAILLVLTILQTYYSAAK